MASVTKLSQQLHRIASQWPVDPFRPHLQLGAFLKALADHPQLTPHATRAARALLENEYAHKVGLILLLFLVREWGWADVKHSIPCRKRS